MRTEVKLTEVITHEAEGQRPELRLGSSRPVGQPPASSSPDL